MQEIISIQTTKNQEVIEITDNVKDVVKMSKISEGLCTIFVMHSTAAIIINENYDPDLRLDLIDALNGMIPKGKWRHDKTDRNGDAHLKSIILGPSETIPIKNGELQLGTWQAPMLVELDGPKERKIIVQVIGD